MDIQKLPFISFIMEIGTWDVSWIHFLKISKFWCLVFCASALLKRSNSSAPGLASSSWSPVCRWVWEKMNIVNFLSIPSMFQNDSYLSHGYWSDPCFKPTWLHSKIPAIRFDVIPSFCGGYPFPQHKVEHKSMIKWTCFRFLKFRSHTSSTMQQPCVYIFFWTLIGSQLLLIVLCEREHAKDRKKKKLQIQSWNLEAAKL